MSGTTLYNLGADVAGGGGGGNETLLHALCSVFSGRSTICKCIHQLTGISSIVVWSERLFLGFLKRTCFIFPNKIFQDFYFSYILYLIVLYLADFTSIMILLPILKEVIRPVMSLMKGHESGPYEGLNCIAGLFLKFYILCKDEGTK